MKRIIMFSVMLLLLFSLTGCKFGAKGTKEMVDLYNARVEIYNEDALPYNEAVQMIIDQNASLEAASDAAQEVINKGETPFDEETLTTLKALMEKVPEIQVAEPEKVAEYEKLTISDDASLKERKEILEQADEGITAMKEIEIPDVPEVPDFSENVKEINDARIAYEDSIQSMKQITAPSDDFVMKRLKTIKSIKEIDHVTEDNDPNGQLNKQGGYIGCIYFSDNRVDRSKLYLDDGDDVISVGTDGGGAVEIFNTKEEADVRDGYLATFDGTGYASGAHYVYGTLIIRASNYLNGTQQKKLVQSVLDALTKVKK